MAESTVVSARHARLELSSKGFWIRDLHSTNGTFVNGARVSSPMPLEPRDRIQLGQTGPFLTVLSYDATSTAAPTDSSAPADAQPAPAQAQPAPTPPLHQTQGNRTAGWIAVSTVILVLGGLLWRLASNNTQGSWPSMRPPPDPAVAIQTQVDTPLTSTIETRSVIETKTNDPIADLQADARERAERFLRELETQIVTQQHEMDRMRNELAALRDDLLPLEKRNVMQQLALDWASRQLDSSVRADADLVSNAAGTRLDAAYAAARFRKWKELRELTGDPSLAMTPELRSAIRSGRALNALLNQCGSAALEHESYRNQMTDQIRGWQAALPGADPRAQTVLNDKIEVAQETLRALAELDGVYRLDDRDVANLRCLSGLGGPKLLVSLSDGLLPLQWPPIMELTEELAPPIKAVEKARTDAVSQLQGGIRVTAEAAQSLIAAINTLELAFQRVQQRYFDRVRETRITDAVEIEQHLAAKKFMEGLRHGVPRLLAARGSEDIVRGKFTGRTAQEVLAFMSRNGLMFAESDTNAEPTYEKLFRMQVAYHMDLQRMDVAFRGDQWRLVAARDEVLQQSQALDQQANEVNHLKQQQDQLLAVAVGTDVYSRIERGATIAAPHLAEILNFLGKLIDVRRQTPLEP